MTLHLSPWDLVSLLPCNPRKQSKMTTRRMDRVNQLIKEEIAKIIQLELKDPRLTLVSVTRVSTSADLRRADVYVSAYGDDKETEEALKALDKAAGFLRRELSEKIEMKYVPRLVIRHDASLAKADKVLKIIEELEQADEEEE